MSNNLNLTDDERRAIFDIGNRTPGLMVAPGVIAHLLMKGLIFIGADQQPEFTERGQKVFDGLMRP